MTLLAVGAIAACVGAPLLVDGLLPQAYRAALPFLPWLVLASVLNESCSLLNVGAYAGHHGYRVLAVNASGAAVALTGYSLLIQPFGVWGAIAATIAGHSARLALYLWSGRREAPIRYPWGLAVALAGLVVFLVVGVKLAPDAVIEAATISVGLAAFAAIAWRAARGAAALFGSQPA